MADTFRSMMDRLEAPPESVITIPNGLPGLPQMEQSVLLRPDDLAPILLLQSLSDARVSLPVVPARVVAPDFHPRLGPDDREALGLSVMVLTRSCWSWSCCRGRAEGRPATSRADPGAPFTRIGRQCLQLGSYYPSLLRLEGT